ncbi:MAG: serine/threonine-protein kinase, partial [Deltaproteobacteria bacterium]|nr:serine/threonine-protein kinase [Deltaproteobacteria bacterium]
MLLQALAAAPPIPVKIDRLSPGTQVGGFQINGVLGAGSMGVVYEAIDLALDRRVALKLHARRGQDVRTSRMWREAKAMARLTHPNVIAVYEVGEHEGRVFIAMELVEGGTVRDWLAEGEPGTIRSWQSILDVFLQAAEGLAAAHAVDLVHRDFKPDNILVGGDGRARVADFGLARGATGGSDSGGAESEDPVSAPDVDMRVTQTGMTVGTPAYMAPEQLTRGEVDHRCDQFSFCVALFEALHGVRPYDAQTLTGLLEQVSGGDIRTPDTDRIVPAWLLSVVRRGLGARPEDRFPSMRQLIIALRDDPSRRRGRIWLGAGVLAALGLTAWVTRAASSVEEPCQGLGDEVRAIWNPSVADRVERALRATGSKVADDASGRVRSTLDDYAGRWGTLRAEACLATRVRGEHSEAMLDRRMLCFERRRQQLEAVVAVLETPDPRVVENAVQTLGVLEALERCSDLEALQSQVPLPADESAREAVADARTRLAQIDADNAAGRGAELGQQVDAVVEHAMVQAFPPLLAEAHHMRAVVLTAADQRQAAIDESVVAHRFATQAGDARLAWRSALLAASRIGDTATGTDDALRWLEVADGWAQRFALDTGDRGYALQIRANIFQQGDRLEDALLDLRRSLAMTHDEPDPRAKAGDMGNRHNGIAFLLYRLARHDEAREHAQLAIRLLEDAYGVGHPLVARALAVLSYIERGRGDNAASLEAIERSLAIRQQSPGPASASLASALRERADAL